MPNEFPLPTPGPSLPVDAYPPSPTPLPPPEENPSMPPAYEPPQPAVAPQIKSSPFKFLIPVLAGVVVLGIIVFVISKIAGGLGTKPTRSATADKTVTLNYWGLWETPAIMKPVLAAFESANPGIKVNYQLQSQQDYQDRLQTAMTSTTPPDVARIHATWLPIFIKDLLPAPANTISATEIQANFPQVVADSVLVGNQVYGVPMNLDGLVLFVNTNVLKQANITTIKTWEDLRTAARTLTKRDEVTGKITRAGVALGTSSNITAWPDIISLMMLQGGINLLNPQGRTVQEALSYYTSFAGANQFWDDTMPNSVLAFANEKVAMIIAPLWSVPEIQAINPGLVWETRELPQLPDSDSINWASFWIETVPKNSAHPQEAWKLVSFLSSAKAQQLLFESAVKERGSAEVPANKATASVAQTNPISAALVSGVPTAKTFYTASMTHDSPTGLNSRLIKYLEDAVNATSQRLEVAKIVDTLSSGFNQVLSQYRLVNPNPTPTTQ